MRCPVCGAESPEGKRYCADCGAPLPRPPTTELAPRPARDEPPDEIRTVTVLFGDVAGSTELAAHLGLETVKDVMDSVFDRLYQVVLQHGGTVDKYIGDCIMALFGAPLAFGDDAARAVRAALAIQRTLADLEPKLAARGLPAVKMRIGINTGPVIAGAVGAGPERRYTVVGHGVNIAAHLQREAPVGGVLVGPETFRRIRGLFYLSELATEAGKAYQVMAERAGGLWLRPREILGREVETVGRAPELEALMRELTACTDASEARLLLVVGEPGIGKSRLLFEWLERVEEELPDARSIVGFAHPLSAGVPFSVAAEAVRRGLGISLTEPPLGALTKLHTLLESLGRPSVEADQSTLARILGLPIAEAAPDEDPGFPRRVLDLLADVVDWLTTRHPTVLVIEDLHWCDSSSLALMDHLLQRLAPKRLLVVGLTRPDLLAEHPELLDGPRRARLDLGPLDRAAVGQLLDQAVGPDSGRLLLDRVADAALGNPYHVEELLRVFEERRVLVRRPGGWEVRELPAELEIPPGVEAVTQARVDNLTPRQRRLLCEAAAAGRTFWDGLLRVVHQGFSPQDLSQLVRRELVVPRESSAFRDQKEYAFAHDLTRDVAYRMLPEPRRADLHRRIAAWLQEQGAVGPEELALVGRHLDLGGRPDEAALYLARAGDAAYAAAAYATAVMHYGRAVELVRDPGGVFDLLARRERVLNALGRWAEQRRDADQMLQLAEGLGESRRVEALLRSGRARLNIGEHEQAREAFEEAHRLATRIDDVDGQARALRWLAMCHFNRAEHLPARDLFERALKLAERSGLASLAAELAYELGVTVGTIGDYPQALAVSRRALEMFRQQANRYQEAFCLGNLGCFHVYLGDYEEAVTALEEAARLGRAMGIPLAEASANANLGNAFRMLGRAEEALLLELEARDIARQIGDPRLVSDALVYAARAGLDAGRPALAEELAGEALTQARQAGLPGTEAAAQLALARVLGATGRAAEAARASAEAVCILDRIGSVEGLEPEILLVHGDLCRQLGRTAEAEACLARARQEISRKAAFITAPERRARFVAELVRHAGVPQELAHGA